MERIRESVEVWIARPAPSGVRILLLRKPERLAGPRPHPPFWQAVTGGIEPGETAPRAAVREVREETGLAIDERALFTVLPLIELPLDDGPLLRRRVFAAEVRRETVALTEHDDARWTEPDAVPGMLHWPSSRIAWAALIESRWLDSVRPSGSDAAGPA